MKHKILYVFACAAALLSSCTALSREELRLSKHEFPIEELVYAQNSAFPEAWTKQGYGEFVDDDIGPALIKYFGISSDGEEILFAQEVHIFANSLFARMHFQSVWKASYAEGAYKPLEWKYIPEKADDFDYRCFNLINSANSDYCQFLIRYKDVVIFLKMSVQDFSFEDSRRIIRATDSFFSGYDDPLK